MRLVTLARSLVKEKPGHAYMLLTAVVLVSFGVVGFRIGSSTPSYKVATWCPPAGAGALPEGRALTGVTGLLAGRINADGTACFWLSNEGYQPALMWPPRYSAHGNPLTVYSQNGQPVATVGRVRESRWRCDGSGRHPQRACVGLPTNVVTDTRCSVTWWLADGEDASMTVASGIQPGDTGTSKQKLP